MIRIIEGDVLRFAAHYKGPKFHAVLCDPPYELGFMSRDWDSRGISFDKNTWSAIASVCLPGAHLLAFGGTKTFHRVMTAIEDGGFEIRDTLGWVYGQGYPKSQNVGKTIDRQLGLSREERPHPTNSCPGGKWCNCMELDATGRYSPTKHPAATDPVSEEAKAWNGYGTGLKPAWEPVIMARTPFSGTVAENCLTNSTGAINIDSTRVPYETQDLEQRLKRTGNRGGIVYGSTASVNYSNGMLAPVNLEGRWPANIIHDGSEEALSIFPYEEGEAGSAARFFYCPKASRKEKSEGLNSQNTHPTVKPVALAEYLARMVKPPDSVESRIFIPFAGSGSEMVGAILAGWKCVLGVEREREFVNIARARIKYYEQK